MSPNPNHTKNLDRGMQKWLLRHFRKSTNLSLVCCVQKWTLRPFAESMIFALDCCVQKRKLRPFTDSTIFALDCRLQKRTLRPFAYETAIAMCKTSVQNRHHHLDSHGRAKRTLPCKKISACNTIFLSFYLLVVGTNNTRERQ